MERKLPRILSFIICLALTVEYVSPALHNLADEYARKAIANDEFQIYITKEEQSKELASEVHNIKNPSSPETPTNSRPFLKRKPKFPANRTLDKSEDLLTNNVLILAEIEKSIYHLFLSAAIKDFHDRMISIADKTGLLFTVEEKETLGNASCNDCGETELKLLLMEFLTIMEKYPTLLRNAKLRNHVLTEYDRAKDYLKLKVQQFRADLTAMQYNYQFYDMRDYYKMKERELGAMQILYDWFEALEKSGKIDEDALKQKLLRHLMREKRYWLIRIPGMINKK